MLQFCVLSHSGHSCLLEGHEIALWLVLQGVWGFSSDPSSALSLTASEAGQLWSCLQGEALGQQPAGAGSWGLPDSLVLDGQEVAMKSPSCLVVLVQLEPVPVVVVWWGEGGPGLRTCPLHPEWTLRVCSQSDFFLFWG